MENDEIARRLGVACNPQFFSGFYKGSNWVGGKSTSTVFTITLNKDGNDLHAKADKFATFIGET